MKIVDRRLLRMVFVKVIKCPSILYLFNEDCRQTIATSSFPSSNKIYICSIKHSIFLVCNNIYLRSITCLVASLSYLQLAVNLLKLYQTRQVTVLTLEEVLIQTTQVNVEGVRVIVFNATFSNISVISWWSVLLVEEPGVSWENRRPDVSHW